jgi:hypothetical protein
MSIELAVAGYAANKIRDIVEDRLLGGVVARWSRLRTERFVNTLCDALSAGSNSDGSKSKLGAILDRIGAEDDTSEMLYEAYRRVVLSASKESGPRVIALLTAEILLDKRVATESEELLFAAAEVLTDSEFTDLAEFAFADPGKDPTQSSGSIKINLWRESIDSNWHRDTRVPLTSPLLEIGTWALKLRNLGLVYEDVEERVRSYNADPDYHVEEPGVERIISCDLILDGSLRKLITLFRTSEELRSAKSSAGER